MIDLDKEYKTENGYKTKLCFIDGIKVYGFAQIEDKNWIGFSWYASDGKFYERVTSPQDLVEVKKRIKRTIWLSIYEDCTLSSSSKEEADYDDGDDRLACIKVEIDCDEGEGL